MTTQIWSPAWESHQVSTKERVFFTGLPQDFYARAEVMAPTAGKVDFAIRWVSANGSARIELPDGAPPLYFIARNLVVSGFPRMPSAPNSGSIRIDWQTSPFPQPEQPPPAVQEAD